jgi:hypothetical protein
VSEGIKARQGPISSHESLDACAAPVGRLSRDAVRLLIVLGIGQLVPTLATQFPHILQQLAAMWDRPNDTESYLDQLLLPGRDGHHGLPISAVGEVILLRDRHYSHLAKRVR